MTKRSQSPRSLRESARAMSTPSPRSRSNSTQRRNGHVKRRASSPEPRHDNRRSSLRRHISPRRTTTPRRLSLHRRERRSPSPRPSPSIEELKNIKIEIKNTAVGGESRILIRRRSDEGKRNLFDRDEIKYHKIQHDEAIDDKNNNSGDGEVSGRRSSRERRRSRSPAPKSVDKPRETIERFLIRSHRSPERSRGPTSERRRSPSRGDNCPPPLKEERPFFPGVCPGMISVQYVTVPVMPHPRPFCPPRPMRPTFMGAPPRPMGPRPRLPFMPPSGPRYYP